MQLAAHLSANMLKEERELFLGPALNDPRDEPEGCRHSALKSAPAIAMPCPVAIALPIPVPDPIRNDPGYDPSVSAVIDRLVAQEKAEGVSSTTIKQFKSFGAVFTMITGVVDVRLIKPGNPHRG